MAKKNPSPIAQMNPRSPITEAYRVVRTNLQFASIVQDTKVILLTSTQSAEGKTSTACNIAVVSAQAGKRVLLVDADMRKPQVHHVFRLSNLRGLSSVLVKESTIEESISSLDVDNLYVLPSGPIPPNPSEILSSNAFMDLIGDLRDQFDLIIVDSPPVLAVSDPLVLTRVTDGTVFVVDSQNTKRNLAQRALATLKQVNTRILGVVLNRVSKKSHDGNYYYQYYSAEQVKA